MTAKEAREFVLSKWKDAELVGYPDGDYAIFSREAGHASGTGYIGWGQTKYNVRVADEAWIDAASNLPTPVEPKAQVESASVEPAPKEGERCRPHQEGCICYRCEDWDKAHEPAEVEAGDGVELVDQLSEAAYALGNWSTLRESSQETIDYWTKRVNELKSQLKASLLREKELLDKIARLEGSVK